MKEMLDNGFTLYVSKKDNKVLGMGLKPLKRNKRKYSSYKGTIGKIADNLINREICI